MCNKKIGTPVLPLLDISGATHNELLHTDRIVGNYGFVCCCILQTLFSSMTKNISPYDIRIKRYLKLNANSDQLLQYFLSSWLIDYIISIT